jgi:hypothetical protein
MRVSALVALDGRELVQPITAGVGSSSARGPHAGKSQASVNSDWAFKAWTQVSVNVHACSQPLLHL